MTLPDRPLIWRADEDPPPHPPTIDSPSPPRKATEWRPATFPATWGFRSASADVRRIFVNIASSLIMRPGGGPGNQRRPPLTREVRNPTRSPRVRGDYAALRSIGRASR